ncbi:hypothetical protein ATANTOWER_022109, partial [Ataeniobius toweri]|nr:hypothetical protein [Ataeniobius toweri]
QKHVSLFLKAFSNDVELSSVKMVLGNLKLMYPEKLVNLNLCSIRLPVVCPCFLFSPRTKSQQTLWQMIGVPGDAAAGEEGGLQMLFSQRCTILSAACRPPHSHTVVIIQPITESSLTGMGCSSHFQLLWMVAFLSKRG